GGYDLYARVLAQHLGKHIPGNPTVVPQNMPGAGSIKAAAYVFSAAPKDGTLCITWEDSPAKHWDDVMAKQVVFGGEGPAGDPDIFARLYKNVFGAKIKLATGFPGTTDITLAMQRREVDGLCGISWSTVKARYGNWVKEKRIHLLLQAAPQKAPDLPNVPMASDYAKTTEQRQMLDFALASEI